MTVTVNLLGQFELRINGVEQPVRARKTRALIAWLAMHAGERQPRSKIASLLWGDSGTQQARQSLRQSVTDLRRVLGDHADLVDADVERIQFSADGVMTDVATFELLAESAEEADIVAAVGLYRGAFLEAEDPRAEEMDAWIAAEQDRLAEVHLSVLHRLVDNLRHTDLAEAVRYGQRIVQLDPLQGQMQRRLMELYRDLGRPEEAVRQFRAYKAALETELGIEPEAETEALLEEIVAARHQTVEAITPTPASPDSVKPGRGAELRQVAVLAVHVKNLGALATSLDPEAYTQHIATLHDRLVALAESQGGIPSQESPESSVFLFGLPTASGSESRRAMEAALAIRDGVGEEFELSVALGSGQVMVSTAGEAQGAIISQAADLARQAKPGVVVAPADMVEAIPHVVIHEPLSDIAFPGNCCVVRVDDVTDEPILTPFSGRKLQMQQLLLALEACRDTSLGQTIWLRGEPGLGKSRIVSELVVEARERGFAAARANLSETTDSNISNLTRLVATILEFDEDVTPEEVRDEDLERLGLGLGQRSALIDLLDLEMPDTLQAYWNSLTDDRRQETRRAGLDAIVAHATRETPVVTVIEDLQWAEPSILARIGVLASIIADYPMVLVLTSRIDDALDETTWRGPSQKAPFMTLDLNPLREDEALELGRHMSDDDLLIQECYQRSGGNPLFLEHLLRHAAVSNQHVPDSIQALVEATIYRLSGTDLDAIQAASVLGFEFTREALQALMPVPDYSPLALLRQNLLIKTGETYQFSHALVREGSYKTMLRSRRSTLHLAAAAWFKPRNRALFVDHLLMAESDDAAPELLAIAQEEQRLHRNDRARIMVKKGLSASADEQTRRAFKLLEDSLAAADPGWEALVKSSP